MIRSFIKRTESKVILAFLAVFIGFTVAGLIQHRNVAATLDKGVSIEIAGKVVDDVMRIRANSEKADDAARDFLDRHGASDSRRYGDAIGDIDRGLTRLQSVLAGIPEQAAKIAFARQEFDAIRSEIQDLSNASRPIGLEADKFHRLNTPLTEVSAWAIARISEREKEVRKQIDTIASRLLIGAVIAMILFLAALGFLLWEFWEQRNKSEQIRHAERMSVLGEMAAGIAHEINNPLMIISGSVHQLEILAAQKCPDDIARAAGEPMAKMRSAIERAANIIQALREFARDGSNDKKRETNIGSLMRDVLDLNEMVFRAQGVRLEVHCDDGLMWVCRPTDLRQAVYNIVRNGFEAAIDAREHGGSDPCVAVSVKAENARLRIEVRDSGDGVPKEIRSRIMQPFFSTKKARRHSGMGLSVACSLIERQGGRLWLDESKDNTTFVIEIP